MPDAPVQGLGAPQVGPPSNVTPSPEADPANSAPSLPETFQRSSSLTPVNPIRPSSDASSIRVNKDSEPASAPEADDRTAARPTYRNWSYYGVNAQRTSSASDDAGWRSAR